VRDEYRLSTRAFVFGQNQYLRDEFKNIDYLLAPTAGLGYKLFDTATTKLTVDGSVGGVWEKNPGLDVRFVRGLGVR
jgi:putative salt-induced outer membrane protein YdiY